MFYSNNDFYKFVKQDQESIPLRDREGWVEYFQRRMLELHGKRIPTRKQAAEVLAEVKQAIIDRQESVDICGSLPRSYTEFSVAKFCRPWHVVDKLRNFRPPQGDYGVGIEVEYGFNSHEDSVATVMHIKHWKHIAVDKEGYPYGVETTFAPVLYSKLTKKSQCFRYLDYLASQQGRLHRHAMQDDQGTHVNVSAHELLDVERCAVVGSVLQYQTTREQRIRFFGRPNPYGFGRVRSTSGGHNYIEWKLFNSTTDSKRLQQYINVAVSLTKLVEGSDPINIESVTAACERGLAGRVK
jgi:hypothetical protein